MAAILMVAFTFEAYLNDLGARTLDFWESIDRIGVLEKYAVLCRVNGLAPDYSHRPHQTLKGLFAFRNQIAHGKTEILQAEKVIAADDDPMSHAPKTKWESYCTVENAEQALEDVTSIIEGLHAAAGLESHALGFGITSSSISALPGE